MIIYHLWDGSDQVLSQGYYPTFAEVVRTARADYGIKGPIKLDAEGRWEGIAGDDAGSASGMDVHIQRRDIRPTREGLCRALKNVPNF